MIELNYKRSGDYLLPDLGLTETEQLPLGTSMACSDSAIWRRTDRVCTRD